MQLNNFKYFINSKDSSNSLSVTYSTKSGLDYTETFAHPEIKKCPFCGSPAHLKPGIAFDSPFVKVVCTKCFIGTSHISTGRYLIPDVDYSFQDVINKSIELWNNRAYAGNIE